MGENEFYQFTRRIYGNNTQKKLDAVFMGSKDKDHCAWIQILNPQSQYPSCVFWIITQ